MDWFNYIGLIIITIMMIPNVICARLDKNSFINIYQNKKIETLEQVGRYGCFISMIFNIPYLYFDFFFNNGLIIYIVINAILLCIYIITWIVCFNKYLIMKAYILSIIPTIIFLFSGIMIRNILLIVCSIIFGFAHITISLNNAYKKQKNAFQGEK